MKGSTRKLQRGGEAGRVRKGLLGMSKEYEQANLDRGLKEQMEIRAADTSPRIKRDAKLKKSDWTQGADVPSAIKDAWATYRQQLRDLPTTISKPSFATFDVQQEHVMSTNLLASFPAEPS